MKSKTAVTAYKRAKAGKLKEKAFIIALVIYPVIHFAIFWAYINFDTIVLTFQSYHPVTNQVKWVGLKNYIEVFRKMVLGLDGGKALQTAFFNSFRAIYINAVILPMAVFSAYAFYKNMPGSKFYSVMFYIPQLISIVVLTMVYRYMFDADFGPLNKLFSAIAGVESIDFLSLSSDRLWGVIGFYCVWTGLGSNVIMMRGAMNKVPKEVVESAVLDGCGFFRELWSITLPLCMSTIGMYILMISMSAAQFTMPPYMIAGSAGVEGKFMTIGWFIFQQTSGSASNSRLITAATTGLLFTVITVPLVFGAKIFTKKITPEF